jgi:long-chain fatty acid transport protein
MRLSHMILGTGLCLSSTVVGAAGFALSEQSGSGLGTATAGGAAGEDASTIYSNPAGMTRLTGTQVVISGALISSRIRFENTGSTNPAGILAPSPLGASGGDAGTNAFVPNIYLSHALSPAWRLGLGVNAPFGLRTEYESGWVGRFQSVRSELSSVNQNPSIAYRLSDIVSVGAGVSYQLVSA